MINIDNLTELYFSTDEPVPYHLSCGFDILIYPIKVSQWAIFNGNLGILSINKNEINDADIIRMSYLDFIVNLCKQNKEHFLNLAVIIKYSLGENIISFEKDKGKNVLAVSDESILENGDKTYIIKYFINSKEFDEIKRIILYQNVYDYDDIELSPDVKKIVEDYYMLTNSGNKKIKLEEKMAFIGNICGLKKEEILGMTYRDFTVRFELALEQIEYSINKTAEMSGNIKFKSKIEHFIFKKKKDKLSQFFVNDDSVRDKIEGASPE